MINQDHHELINLQQADIHLRDIIHELQYMIDKKYQRASKDAFTIIDNVLYYVDPLSQRLWLALPLALQEQLMKEAHSGAFSEHFAAQAMYRKPATLFCRRKYTLIFIITAVSASFGGGVCKYHPPLQTISVGAPFESVGIDMKLPQTCEGN